MQSFEEIYQRAVTRKGSEEQLQALLPSVLEHSAAIELGSDRFLAEMTRCIFQAGFVWRVINQKWQGFEDAFFQFDPFKMLLLSPEHIERLSQDTRIVRNMQKIISVPKNAQFIIDIEKDHNSFAHFVCGWPKDNLIELLQVFKKRGNRLGGMTGPRVLRNLGIDTFILTKDVVHCLQLAGVDIKGNPTSKGDLLKVQNAFNQWHSESGLAMTHISTICAHSTGKNTTGTAES